MTSALLIALQSSVVVLLVAIGMSSTLADVTWLWRRPALLVRSLAAMYLVVPLAIFALVALLPVAQGVAAVLLVLAVSAGAPLLPRKLGTVGGNPYAYSLVLTSSLCAIVLVPAWVALMSRHFGAAASISPLTVALALAKAFVVPLAIGMAWRAISPRSAEAIAGRAFAAAGVALIACGLLLVVDQWTTVTRIGAGGFTMLLAALCLALAIGHLMGGPEAEDRTILAISCATRHVGVAILVASTFPGPGPVALMTAYFLASLLVTVPYLRLRRLVARKG